MSMKSKCGKRHCLATMDKSSNETVTTKVDNVHKLYIQINDMEPEYEGWKKTSHLSY